MKKTSKLVVVFFLLLFLLPIRGLAQSKEDAIQLHKEAETLQQKALSNEDRQQAAQKYEEALKIYEQLGDQRNAGMVLNKLGLLSKNGGQYEKALQFYNRALLIQKKTGDQHGEGQTLNNMGWVYMSLGKYDRALDLYTKALAIKKDLKDREGEGISLNNIAWVHWCQGEYQQAFDLYTKALVIKRELNDPAGELISLNGLGLIYKQWGQYQKAVEYYEKSLEIARKLGDLEGEETPLNNLGNVYKDWGQYQKAAEYYEKSLAISQKFGNPQGEALHLSNLGLVYADWGDYAKAMEFYEKALAIRTDLKDSAGEAETRNNMGWIYAQQGKYAKAMEFYEKALDVRNDLKDRAGEGTTLNNMGWVHMSRGEYSKAMELYTKAMAIRIALKDPAGVGTTLNSIAWIHRLRNEYSKAEELYEKALVIKRELKDPAGELITLNDLGVVYRDWGQYQKAVEYYEKSLELARKLGNRQGEVYPLNNLGLVYSDWGQYQKAVEYYEKSLNTAQELGDPQSQVKPLNNLGLVYADWGHYEKAVEYYEKSLELARKLESLQGEDSPLNNLGLVYADWGQYQKAVEYYEKSLEIKRKLGDRRGEAQTLMNVGRVHEHRGDLAQAMAAYENGLAIYTSLQIPTYWPKDLIGNLYLDMGDTTKAESFLKEAGYYRSLGRLALVRLDYKSATEQYKKVLEGAEKSRNADNLFTAYTGLGMASEGLAENAEAAEYYRKAVDLTEQLRSSLNEAEREAFFDVKINGFYRTAPYDGLSRVLLKMNKSSEAFKQSEYTKARIFAESISRKSGYAGRDVPKEVRDRDALLFDQLSALTKNLQKAYESGNEEVIKSLEPQAKEAKEKLALHIEILRKKYPLFAATQYPLPMDLSQTALNDDERVLSYNVTDQGLLIYLTKGKTLVKALFKSIARKDLDGLVSKFRESVDMKPEDDEETMVGKLKSFDFRAGKKLSDLLLNDVMALIPSDVPLIVVPDHCLGVLPFEMLPLNVGGKIASDGITWTTSDAVFFGDRNPISYYESVTALTLARTFGKRNSAEKKSLVIDDPVFEADDPRLKQFGGKQKRAAQSTYTDRLCAAIKTEINLEFRRLEHTRELGEVLKRLQPAQTEEYTAMEARKSLVYEKPLDQYGSMVFATHGYFGKELPGIMEPVLVLTLVNQPPDTDGFLRLSEVMGLRLNADIVALTACQTGIGRHVSGEGTMGMGRAFQYAGARAVLMSLWNVSEKASVNLVGNFFKRLKEGKNKLEALKLARKEIREQGYDHPFYWAPFILVGEVN